MKIAIIITGLVIGALSLGFKGTETHGSGAHGGDDIQREFLVAKREAAHWLLQMKDLSQIDASWPNVLVDWLGDNREALAEDIELSEHIWMNASGPSCNLSRKFKTADLKLSIPVCRRESQGSKGAVKIVVQESVFHLGEKDPDFAEAIGTIVALALTNP